MSSYAVALQNLCWGFESFCPCHSEALKTLCFQGFFVCPNFVDPNLTPFGVKMAGKRDVHWWTLGSVLRPPDASVPLYVHTHPWWMRLNNVPVRQKWFWWGCQCGCLLLRTYGAYRGNAFPALCFGRYAWSGAVLWSATNSFQICLWKQVRTHCSNDILPLKHANTMHTIHFSQISSLQDQLRLWRPWVRIPHGTPKEKGSSCAFATRESLESIRIRA